MFTLALVGKVTVAVVLVLSHAACFAVGWLVRKNSPNTAVKVDDKVNKAKELVK